MKAVIMCPMWKRPRLTNYIFNYYNQMKSIILSFMELILIAVGSEKEVSRKIAESNGFDYLECPNMPLNRKFNAGIEYAKKYNPDVLFLLNSDDIITADYFINIKPQSDAVVGFRDLYFLDFHTKRLGYWSGYKEKEQEWRKGEPLGAGRCFSKETLERCDWKPWPQEKELMKCLDINCRRKMHSSGIKMKSFKMEELGCFAMDVKMENNLWPWSTYKYEKIIEGKELEAIFRLHGISDIFELDDSVV